jgi:hypothetical protein
MRTEATPAGVSGGQQLLATDWKPSQKSTLRGRFSIVTADGLKINGLMLYEGDGRRWIRLPGEFCEGPDREMRYVETIEFQNDEARRRFFDAALHALEELLDRQLPWD